jgi:hypothetical protein
VLLVPLPVLPLTLPRVLLALLPVLPLTLLKAQWLLALALLTLPRLALQLLWTQRKPLLAMLLRKPLMLLLPQ